jgi:hypothetical protein
MYELFIARLDDIQRRAERMGLTLTDICRDTKIGRATPDRWREEVPATIAKLDQMTAWVAAKEDKLKRELGAD